MFSGVNPQPLIQARPNVPVGWQTFTGQSISLVGRTSLTLDGFPPWANFLRGRIAAFPSAATAVALFVFRKGAGVDITSYFTEAIIGQNASALATGPTAGASLSMGSMVNTTGGGLSVNFDFDDISESRYHWGSSRGGTVDATFLYSVARSHRIDDANPITGLTVSIDTGTFAAGRLLLEFAA